ncbi:MAG: endonuclease/exonuclease/phosphatase family protein [Methanomicrobiales archaeon]|nr:endonuclease/exonuclease/phosphatase family protein [Methanomicrobiales archaeon]
MPLKIVSWNLEWADTLLPDSKATIAKRGPDPARCKKIYQALKEMDPDILCVLEGPAGVKRAEQFGTEVFDDEWVPILLDSPGTKDKNYCTGGWQWIWFYVKPELKDRCRLQAPAIWQEKTECKKWPVHLWGEMYTTKDHEHYRHPQVLVYEFDDGREMELIGAHLKSLYMNTKFKRDENNNIVREYMNEALTNRIKLATEARNVRKYITKRFEECGDKPPAIMILGDCNDGPGQDYFEDNYLFYSVVSNLEGSLIESEEFFYHALFDFDPDLSWSIRFDDPVTKKSAKENPLLLDHILFSQPLANGSYPLRAAKHAGKVEHEIWEKYSPNKKNMVSDHRPVSLLLT